MGTSISFSGSVIIFESEKLIALSFGFVDCARPAVFSLELRKYHENLVRTH